MGIELVTDIRVEQDQWGRGRVELHLLVEAQITGETSASYHFRNNWPLL